MKLSEFRQNIASDKRFYFESQEAGDKIRDLERILDVVKNINSTLVLDDVMTLVLTNAIEITESERGFIVLQNSDGNLEYRLGLNAKGLKLPEHSFSLSTSVVEDVFKSEEAQFIEGAQSNKNNFVSQSIVKLSLETILCSPLITNEKKIGVIYVDSKNLKKISSREILYTFEILAGQAAIGIRNAQLYCELNEARQKAEKSDKLKSEFLAQVSHEIKIPINAILNSTSLIKSELSHSLNPELKVFFEITESSSKRIIRTVDLVLNMSNLQTGNYELADIHFDLFSNILVGIFNQFKPAAENKKINFTLNKNTADTLLYADEYSVNQIFSNLIDNAIKYTETGNIDINVFRDNEGKLIVDVSDTGIGISTEFIPHLFKSFSQEDQGYTRKFEGNGLGLALAKRYCDLNNASINVKSEKWVGSTFSVTFKK